MDAAAEVGATVVLGDVSEDLLASRFFTRYFDGEKPWKRACLKIQQENDEDIPQTAAVAAEIQSADAPYPELYLPTDCQKWFQDVGCEAGPRRHMFNTSISKFLSTVASLPLKLKPPRTPPPLTVCPYYCVLGTPLWIPQFGYVMFHIVYYS